MCALPTTTSASGRRPADSYLKIPNIIAAAEITGADAIHPGYGFLAENAEFADTCKASNITFIGPTGDQIRQMGDKATARRLATEAGVPTVPGSPGRSRTWTTPSAFANEIGFPVIIKATAGGGGKGMRIAHDADSSPSSSVWPRTRRWQPSATARCTSRSIWSTRGTSRSR